MRTDAGALATLTRTLPVPPMRQLAVGAGAVLFAVVAGAAFAFDIRAGTGLVLALLYAALALTNLSLAVALWVPLTFLQELPAFNLGAEAAGVLLAAAWLGTLRRTDIAGVVSTVIRENARMFAALVLLLVWLTLSLLWATNPARVLEDVWHWYALAVLLLVLSTTLKDERTVRLVLVGFVAGAVFSVFYGLFSRSLIAPGDAAERLEGGGGDPNFLAASLVAAIVVAGALAASSRHRQARAALVAAIPVLVAGLVASQSRGGLLAGLLTVVVSFFVFKRGRIYVAAFTLLVIGAAIMWFSLTPGAWERVTTFDAGGSGRITLWTGAWRAAEDQPVAGVGLNNFRDVAPDYAREPGSLEAVRVLAERPRFVHNTFLQILAENGIVGLGLYLGFALGCLGAAWKAARRFAAQRRESLETISRAVFVGGISMMIAAFFLSSAIDQRIWVLFALGPALLGIASRLRQAAPPVPG